MDSNSKNPVEGRSELERVRRVADMLCTAHATLRDRYSRRALTADFLLLGFSTWIVALAFADPAINAELTPWHLAPNIWQGLLSVGVFLLAIIQLKTDWKGRADAHKRTLDLYAEVKREAGYILAAAGIDDAAYRRVLSRYDMASAVGVNLPEDQFLGLKKKHRLKLAISKRLDSSPAASIIILRMKMWLTDNFKRSEDVS